MNTTLAEDVLLLLLDSAKGTVSSSAPIQTVLGGAVLAELALDEHVTVGEKPGLWRKAKVHASSSVSPPSDPVLREALEQVAEKVRTAEGLVDRLGKGLKDRLADRLVERGVLERRDHKVLGLFPRTRWPETDATHEQEVRRALRAVLVEGAEPDPRTGAAVSLLNAIGRAHKVIDHEGLSAREVKKRAKEVAAGDWVAKAVKDTIDASMAAIVAVTASAGADGGSS